MKHNLTEEDIAAIGEKYLQEKAWSTFPEVVIPIFGGRPDIIACKGNLSLVAEAKKTLSYPVIEQLVRWHLDYRKAVESEYRDESVLAIPHLMYAVVAGTHSVSDLKADILNRYGIGVLGVFSEYEPRPFSESEAWVSHNDKGWKVVEILSPKIQKGSRGTGHRIIDHLNPDMRCATPGASGKKGGYMTPFKRTMEKVWDFIMTKKAGDTVHIAHIVENLNASGGHHYSNDSSARLSIQRALIREGVEIELCRALVPAERPKKR